MGYSAVAPFLDLFVVEFSASVELVLWIIRSSLSIHKLRQEGEGRGSRVNFFFSFLRYVKGVGGGVNGLVFL